VLLRYALVDAPIFERTLSVELLSEHLKAVCQAVDAKTKTVTLAVDATDSIVRQAELPLMPVGDMRQILKNNTKNYLQHDLPGYITINPPPNFGGAVNFGSAFLPAHFQGTRINDVGEMPNLKAQTAPSLQRRQLAKRNSGVELIQIEQQDPRDTVVLKGNWDAVPKVWMVIGPLVGGAVEQQAARGVPAGPDRWHAEPGDGEIADASGDDRVIDVDVNGAQPVAQDAGVQRVIDRWNGEAVGGVSQRGLTPCGI
jgi:hypothetical protein